MIWPLPLENHPPSLPSFHPILNTKRKEPTALTAKLPDTHLKLASKLAILKPLYVHCNFTGHTVEKCYKLNGYPLGHKLFTKSRSSHVLATQSISTPATNIADISDTCIGLTKDQYTQIMALLPPGTSTTAQTSSRLHTPPTSHISGIHYCLNAHTHTTSSSHPIPWIIDTGATDHMVCCPSFFTTIVSTASHSVALPNGTHVPATHTGIIQLTPSICLAQVLCVPSFTFNLISVKRLTTNLTCSIIFLSNLCVIQDLFSWTTIGNGEVRNGLYHFVNTNVSPSLLANTLSQFSTNSVAAFISHHHTTANLWHYRLGHSSSPVMSSILDPVVKNNISNISKQPCYVCPLAKFHRLPFSYSKQHDSRPFEIVHCDLWGQCSMPSYDGFKYFLTLVDCFTRSTWLYLLSTKADTKHNIESFANLVENQFNYRIKILRSDNGGEFHMKEFFHTKGIIHQTTCVETPQQNGLVERKHQHLLNVARALRFQANLPLQCWSDCVLTTTYLINHTPSPLLKNKTPFELLFNKSPSYAHLRVFGSLCFASTLSRQRTKFDSCGCISVFLGYPFGIKGYKLLDLQTNTIFISRDVTFHESTFPFQSLPHLSNDSYDNPTCVFTKPLPDTLDFPVIPSQPTPNDLAPSNIHVSLHNINSPAINDSVISTTDPSYESPSYTPAILLSVSPDEVPRRTTRVRRAPQYLHDFHCN